MQTEKTIQFITFKKIYVRVSYPENKPSISGHKHAFKNICIKDFDAAAIILSSIFQSSLPRLVFNDTSFSALHGLNHKGDVKNRTEPKMPLSQPSKQMRKTGLLIGCGKKWEVLRHFQGKLCGKKGLLCGKLCDFLKADLICFLGLRGGNPFFFLSNGQLEHKKTIKASKSNQLLPDFNYFNLK